MRQFMWFTTLLLLGGGMLSAQSVQVTPWQVPVSVNGLNLRYPFAGGLNSPQVSSADFNRDGLNDLYIFDRMGNVHLTFLNTGQPGQPNYVYDPSWAESFPKLADWVMLRDYNGDGIMDIFAFADGPVAGVKVYRGFYDANDRLSFERFNFGNSLNIIYFPLPTGGQTQLYVSAIDYPAVDDLDCDGDLDVLTFNLAGGYIELYRNHSVEMGYGRDSLMFRLQDDCWCGLYESGIGSAAVDLAAAPGDCYENLQDDPNPSTQSRHAGSTLLTFDGDGDGDRDLMLGDLSFTQLNYLTNGGTCSLAWCSMQDDSFPNYDISADIVFFPAAFYVDIDDDGRRDLLAAPNQRLQAEDLDVLWFYHNEGEDDNPQFSLQRRNLLVSDMIDLGSGARPVPVDYNADGLLDLVVGNSSYFENSGAKNSRLFLFENTGTATQPAFTLVDDDYLGFNQYSQSTFYFAPAFGDLDGDGDLDLLVGEQNGQLFHAQNIAGPGQPLAFGPVTYAYMGINVGTTSVPQIIDLNRDGLPDLVVGERTGNINYFPNQGTPTQPQFNPDFTAAPNVQFLGGVDARVPGFSTGYCSPWFLDFGDEFNLLMGTQIGRLEWYGQIEGNLNGSFALLEETWAGLNVGAQTQPAFADFNQDGFLDLVVGNFRGGLTLYQTNLTTQGLVNTGAAPAHLPGPVVFPNPTSGGELTVAWPVGGTYQLRLLDLNGRPLRQWMVQGNQHYTLNLDGPPAGVYVLQFTHGSQTHTQKVVVH